MGLQTTPFGAKVGIGSIGAGVKKSDERLGFARAKSEFRCALSNQ
jgi:hypothetical protein